MPTPNQAQTAGAAHAFPPVLALADGALHVADKGKFAGFTICDAKGAPVAAMSYWDHVNSHGAQWPDAIVKQRAAYIVEAVNSYASDRAEIKALRDALEEIRNGMADDEAYRQCARAALSLGNPGPA